MKQRHENIILITIDSLRWDALFNKDGDIKRYLNFFRSIIKNSIIFRNAFANGAGTPACFPAIMTSTYPLMYGGYKGISRERITIAEVLRRENIQTIGILNNAYLSKYFGYDRGFDIFYDLTEREISFKRRIVYELSKILHKSPTLLDLSQAINMCLNVNPSHLGADDINRYIANLIKNKKMNNPFFLHIHSMDTHLPYYSPSVDYNKYLISKNEIRKLHFKIFAYPHMRWLLSKKDITKIKLLYTLKVRYLDSRLKKLFEMLDKNNFLNNTLVIITADHGEEFLEHGDLIHLPKLYDELIHIPLIVFSKEIDGPLWVDDLTEQLDIAPTIAQAFGIMPPKQYLGKNFFSRHNNKTKKDYIISEVAQPRYKLEIDYNKRTTSIRTKSSKFIWNKERDKCELYNIKTDPEEKIDIAEENGEVLLMFKKILKNHIIKENITNVGNLDFLKKI